MSLTGLQITALARAFDENWDLPKLVMFASNLNINLGNIAPMGSMKERANKFISHMNSALPPRDRELLELLRLQGNAALRAIADEFLAPTFYSPTGNPHDAVILGRSAFINRSNLRLVLRDFTSPNPFTTHVLIVRGDRPCGKSYSWEFLRHLAVNSAGALPQRLRLKDKLYTPKELLEQAALLIRLDLSRLPPMADDPQLSRIDPLINWFKGELSSLQRPYWLVIDDLNDPSVTSAMREMAYAIAYSVEETKAENLWVVLLGYNWPITDPDLRYTAQEDAEFPDPSSIAKHLEWVAQPSQNPLTPARAREITDLLFSKFPKLDKENMIKMTSLVETMGEKLKLGQQP